MIKYNFKLREEARNLKTLGYSREDRRTFVESASFWNSGIVQGSSSVAIFAGGFASCILGSNFIIPAATLVAVGVYSVYRGAKASTLSYWAKLSAENVRAATLTGKDVKGLERFTGETV